MKAKDKSGFTLIELLAVIVVLGIIMLIAVTAVSGVISSSKKSSFKSSAMLVAKQVREYLLSSGETPNTVDCLTNDYGLNPNNYELCKANIYYEGEQPNISVELVGKGNFKGLTIVNSTMDNGTVIEETENSKRLGPLLISQKVGNVTYGDPGNILGGLYYWEDQDKYIFRGGTTITNSSGSGNLDNHQYSSDSYIKTTNVNNYIKVPWENNTQACTDNYSDNPCWRIISVNSDGSITIVRDRGIGNQRFDNTLNLNHTSQPNTCGYNDLLANLYRGNSEMYNRLYGTNGYQNTTLKDYQYLLQPLDICLSKTDNYIGINDSYYTESTYAKDTCNIVANGTTRISVPPLKNQYVRLPYTEEYLNTSLQSQNGVICTGTGQYHCRGKNFMHNKEDYWSLNGLASSSWSLHIVSASGHATYTDASNSLAVRPVVNLKSTILISGGLGTASDPYIIKN